MTFYHVYHDNMQQEFPSSNLLFCGYIWGDYGVIYEVINEEN